MVAPGDATPREPPSTGIGESGRSRVLEAPPPAPTTIGATAMPLPPAAPSAMPVSVGARSAPERLPVRREPASSAKAAASSAKAAMSPAKASASPPAASASQQLWPPAASANPFEIKIK